MARYNLKSVHFTQMEDIAMLQKSGFIGMTLKPTLLNGAVIIFAGDAGTGGATIKMEGHSVRARLLAPSKIPAEELREIIKGASHTLYKAREVVIDLDPLYAAEEIVCAM